ncbi:alpha-L-arabinofuranosidase [Nakamurella flavida]|uniref:OmpL47-type beta-barrel domain-containing protein n=1 Tax=Nakamurella flavida TaxID=363630 RepID=UPI002783B7D0|nr:alpha-L-arabinofuranosidase C-terminal domain-containing protein [Nakamurella flavida]MDP9778433.1 alpha-L-arabinofuranosidase [Nakamurella flavida]
MSRKRGLLGGLLVAALTTGSLTGTVGTAAAADDPAADYTITADPAGQGATIDDAMYGVFFEDINWAADGGLYAELVRNRSFEFLPVDNRSYTGMTAWAPVSVGGGAGTTNTVNDAARMNERNRTYLKVDLANPTGGTFGVRNDGFNAGVPVVQGGRYDFSVFARTTAAAGTPLTVRLQSTAGSPVSDTLSLTAAGDGWVKYSGTLTASLTTDSARLSVQAGGTGTLRLDEVSLFPQDTFKGRKNGLRKDLAQKIADLHPGFIRFPGGCIVNVNSHQGYDAASNYERARSYQWKDSVGPVETRATNANFWGYNQTYGLGYYEYFQFAEDIGAMPVPDVPALINGCGQQLRDGEWNSEALIQRHIQDTLDLIEFANGPVTSTWGKLRADMGHPASFGLTRMEIGNEENYPEAFIGNFVKFRDAIKAKYPDMLLISNSGPDDEGGTFDKHWAQNRAENVEMVDEHYYNSPEWFLQNNRRYDTYDRNGPKVWIGEYASQDNRLFNGLSEAAYMTGLERNADVVKMASYAPLLANVDNVQWTPDMIWFDNDETWGSANYEVQKLFMNNVGDRVVPTTASGKVARATPITGSVGLSTWSTTAKYDDVTVTGTDGASLFADNFDDGNADGWTNLAGRGTWSAADGSYTQSDVRANDTLVKGGAITATDYDLSVKATKTAGAEGFLVGFGVKDSGNYYWWNLGGFNNTRSLVEKATNGGKQTVFEGPHTPIVTDRAYDVDIQVRGSQVTLFLDGVRQGSFTEKVAEPFAQVLTKDDATGDLILKVVNAQNTPAVTRVDLGGAAVAPTATMTVISGDPAAVNSRTALPVRPVTSTITGISASFTRTVPANSVTFIRMAPGDGSADTAAPVVTATLDPAVADGANGWRRSATTLTLAATDTGSGVAGTEYRVGDGPWTAYTGPITVPEGTTTYSHRATDVSGNVSAVGTTSVQRDATAPSVSGSLAGRSVSATAADLTSGVATVEYQLDGGAWTAWTAPVAVDDQAHVVSLRATDRAGLVSAVTAVTVPAAGTGERATVTLTSNASPTAAGWYTQTVLVSLTVPAGTKAQFRLNGAATWSTYSRAFTVSTTGANTLETRLLRSNVIVAGSQTSTPVRVDRRTPSATATRTPSSGTGTPRNPITVTFAGTDIGSGIAGLEYQDNGGGWTPVSGPVTVNSVGTHLLGYRSRDTAGNLSSIRTLTVVINANTVTSVRTTARTVAAGGYATLVLAGYLRYDSLTSVLTLNGAEIALGSVGSDAAGGARNTVQIPPATTAGTYVLTTTGTDGTTASTTLRITG